MKTYNGHRSWNAWNVSLWISNTESTYNYALHCIKETTFHGIKSAGRAATKFMQAYDNQQTSDGAVYNHLSVKLCLQGFLED